MNPSTADLVKAVQATGSSQVVVLPNNKNVRPAAEQVAGLVDQTVKVVATSSIVEGFAALLAYDPDASAEQNAAAMRASACNVVAGEVTQAVRDVTTDVGEVHEGDWIGLGASGVLSVADSIAGASNQLLATLVRPEHELLTIIEGDGSSPANTRRVTEFLAEEYPQISVEVHHGGQPLYPYYFGLVCVTRRRGDFASSATCRSASSATSGKSEPPHSRRSASTTSLIYSRSIRDVTWTGPSASTSPTSTWATRLRSLVRS
jgi:dihydroxyacetone kinase-like predicted kinase